MHTLHYNNRPDIYIDGNPLPKEYFEKMIDDKNALNIVYEENKYIAGLLMVTKNSNSSVPIMKERTIYFINDIVVDSNCRRKGIRKIPMVMED